MYLYKKKPEKYTSVLPAIAKKKIINLLKNFVIFLHLLKYKTCFLYKFDWERYKAYKSTFRVKAANSELVAISDASTLSISSVDI